MTDLVPPWAAPVEPLRLFRDRVLAEADAALARAEEVEHIRAARWEQRHVFGLPPAARALRIVEEGWMHHVGLDELTERAAIYNASALHIGATAEWLDRLLGGLMWRAAGCGVARARLKADGTWDDWDLGDLAPAKSRKESDIGSPVVTIPVYDGFEVVEIFAVELAPGIGSRRVGRVFALTGLACGLGLATPAFLEWRSWSTGAAVVPTPLDWVRAHRVHETTGIVAPLLDEMPAVWLAGIDPDEGLTLDDVAARDRDRFLIESDPLVCAGGPFAAAVAHRLDVARRAAMPKRGEVMVWTAEENRAGEAAE